VPILLAIASIPKLPRIRAIFIYIGCCMLDHEPKAGEEKQAERQRNS
jgi:hypothetical protein